MSLLITGGAGFIGSHSAKLFEEAGRNCVILDNLFTAHTSRPRWGEFVQGDVSDGDLVRRLIRERSISTVVHLAADVHAGASVISPSRYFQNNLGTSIALLDAMMAEGVKQFVFASSCAVYGDSLFPVVDERSPVNPISPYGESKLAVERILPFYSRAYGFRWVALRYFNVAGGLSGLCEDINTSMRIIPRAVRGTSGYGPPLMVFGTDFSTKDGSAVRDYVHVSDVASANLRAVEYVENGRPSAVFNVGSGNGTSVLEIIEAASNLSGSRCAFKVSPRREGDPGCIVAEISKARDLLPWAPCRSTLKEIISSVYGSRREEAVCTAIPDPSAPGFCHQDPETVIE